MTNNNDSIPVLSVGTFVVMVSMMLLFSYGIRETFADEPIVSRDSYHERMLREDMHAMAASVRVLLAIERKDVDERRKKVLRELDVLEGTATIINEGAEIFNYSVMSPYMGSFLYDVEIAREFALKNPPNFEPSTELINSCLFCHQTFE